MSNDTAPLHPPPQPAHVMRILCLANSRKPGGRCVAGRIIVHGHPDVWIRPVSDRDDHAVSEEERHYDNGSEPRVLDIIDIPFIQPIPHSFQQENWLLDPGFYWMNRGRCDWAHLQTFLNQVAPLWINNQSSYSGMNDRIALVQAETLQTSLRLIHVDSLRVEVFRPGAAFNNPKRRVQARFNYAGDQYWIWITDPIYEQRFLAQPDGTYELGESCLTVSLGEHEGYAYKLIAAVMERVQVEGQ